MPRESLPGRRRSWTQKARIPGAAGAPQTFYLTCGEYPDGRLGEIWLEAHREGTFTRGVLSALARVISIALQCGAGVGEIVRALRHLNFPPSGPAEGSAAVAEVSSVADWVAQEIEAAYLPPSAAREGPAEKAAGAYEEGSGA